MDNYFRYSYEKCPICEKEFANDDDIVVCPLCGTPHHRDCYKKNGECSNFDEHNKGFRWAPSEKNKLVTEDTIPLPPINNEGENSSPETFTPPIFADMQNLLSVFPKEIAPDVKTEEVASFIQLNAIKYVEKFFNMNSGKKTFNWGAFFFTPYWFFYRKMYKLGAIFLALTLLLSVGFSFIPSVQKLYSDITEWTEKYNVEEAKDLTEEEIEQAYAERNEMVLGNTTGSALVMLQGGLSLAIQILVGFKANKWYYNHTITNIKKIKSQEPDIQKQRLLFFKSGGASVGITFLAVLVNNMIVMAVEMLSTFIK